MLYYFYLVLEVSTLWGLIVNIDQFIELVHFPTLFKVTYYEFPFLNYQLLNTGSQNQKVNGEITEEKLIGEKLSFAWTTSFYFFPICYIHRVVGYREILGRV